jgi:hypothetical protein
MTEQDMSYQNTPGASQSQERLDGMEENSTTVTAAEMTEQRERVMFEKHVQENGEAIPSNFKTAGDWFNSLKEAQGNYTQGQQEIAALKDQYKEGGVVNPDYVAPEAMAPTEVAPELTGDEELRIPSPTDENVPTELPDAVTQELWNDWTQEFTQTGEMSDATMQTIMAATKLPRGVIDDYLGASKSRMRESFNEASVVVGGRENLKAIFDWAETTLSPQQQQQINTGLAGPSYEVTLRGLASMYNERSATAVKGREPAMTPNLTQVAETDTGFVGYKTKREFTADRNNPRFKLEPQFRMAVEQRMMRTDFNRLPV